MIVFDSIASTFQGIFSKFTGKKTLTTENISEAVHQVRQALLEADVHFTVVNEFIQKVQDQAIGDALIKAVKPGQQFIKLIHDELIALMGTVETPLDLKGKLSVIMVCGLQGSGKTTSCAKLAVYIGKTEKHKKVLLAAADLQRPAAVKQLQKLGVDTGIPVFSMEGEKDPLCVVKKAYEKAASQGFDVLIVDTAGRLQLDEPLMEELTRMHTLLTPRETLFVASATMGQEAVRIAAEFDRRVPITGTILTMLDGNARAGAAISIRKVTQKPLKFEGVGERVTDLQLFHPRSMADRILGMGDVINLVKKAEEHFDRAEQEKLEEKLRKATFTYNDYLKQMGKVKKMGSLQGLIKMLPGMSALGNLDEAGQQFGRMEAMIGSMTPGEKDEKDELSHGRRKRIAQGSGLPVDEVNRLVKEFKRVKQLFKNMPDMKSKMKNFPGLFQ